VVPVFAVFHVTTPVEVSSDAAVLLATLVNVFVNVAPDIVVIFSLLPVRPESHTYDVENVTVGVFVLPAAESAVLYDKVTPVNVSVTVFFATFCRCFFIILLKFCISYSIIR
jgi:hypothetical protein